MESGAEHHNELLERLAFGRRTVNLCLFSWLAAAAFRVTETPLAILFFIGSAIAAAIGALRIAEGTGFSVSKQALAVIASATPLLGLLVMAWLSSHAAKTLRFAGYEVGMFASSKRRRVA